MKLHYVIHESFEAPGAFELWRQVRGYEATFSRVYLGEPLPRSIDDVDFLVVMGGPQSPSTSVADCPHFDAAAECALISRSIRERKAVVGVCLGAQLMGTALGAPHERSPDKEIGKFPIALTAIGREHAMFTHFGDVLEVGHWHGDMPGLTSSSRLIAASEGCPLQIVEYGQLAFGLQCHLELTPEVVESLIAASAHELTAFAHHRFVQRAADLRSHDYREMNHKLFTFLDRLMDAYDTIHR